VFEDIDLATCGPTGAAAIRAEHPIAGHVPRPFGSFARTSMRP
jgi:hypothetical protein